MSTFPSCTNSTIEMDHTTKKQLSASTRVDDDSSSIRHRSISHEIPPISNDDDIRKLHSFEPGNDETWITEENHKNPKDISFFEHCSRYFGAFIIVVIMKILKYRIALRRMFQVFLIMNFLISIARIHELVMSLGK